MFFICEDINECDYLCKAENVTCENLFGSYQCLCPYGSFYSDASLTCQGNFVYCIKMLNGC